MRKTIYTRQAECVRETIVEMRRKAGLSQRQLAARLGRERNLVGRLEVGQRRLDLVEFYSICKACDADLKNVLQRLLHKFEEIQTVAGQPERRAGRRAAIL
jgi:transcriptional regulator with XRE-family HTH domain